MYCKFRMSRRTLFGFGATLLSLSFWGCGSDNNSNNVNQSGVRTFNAFVPSTGNSATLNVTSGASSLSGQSGLAFGQFSPSSGFTMVSSGTFNPSVTSQDLVTPLQFQTAPTLTGNTNSTLVVTGQSGQVGANAPQLISIPTFDPNQIVIPSGQAAVRFINLSPNSPSLSLFNSTNGGPATAFNNGAGTSNINFGFNSNISPFVFVPASTGNTFSIQSTANPGTNLLLANNNLSNITLQSGQAYTIFTYGETGNVNQPLSAVITTD
jgi:hypothetical protein